MSTSDYCSKCHLKPGDLKRCASCKSALYCSAKCQKAHWPIHKPICRPYSADEVWGIALSPNTNEEIISNNYKQFQHRLMKTNHPIFKRGELCPVTKMCGIPLIVYSQAIAFGGDAPNNQAAVFLRIEPDNGLAPLQWQTLSPGECFFVRQDRKPLTRETIETIWQFHVSLVDAFGYPEYDGWAPVRGAMNPASFQMFSRKYYEEQEKKGRLGFDAFYQPL